MNGTLVPLSLECKADLLEKIIEKLNHHSDRIPPHVLEDICRDIPQALLPSHLALDIWGPQPRPQWKQSLYRFVHQIPSANCWHKLRSDTPVLNKIFESRQPCSTQAYRTRKIKDVLEDRANELVEASISEVYPHYLEYMKYVFLNLCHIVWEGRGASRREMEEIISKVVNLFASSETSLLFNRLKGFWKAAKWETENYDHLRVQTDWGMRAYDLSYYTRASFNMLYQWRKQKEKSSTIFRRHLASPYYANRKQLHCQFLSTPCIAYYLLEGMVSFQSICELLTCNLETAQEDFRMHYATQFSEKQAAGANNQSQFSSTASDRRPQKRSRNSNYGLGNDNWTHNSGDSPEIGQPLVLPPVTTIVATSSSGYPSSVTTSSYPALREEGVHGEELNSDSCARYTAEQRLSGQAQPSIPYNMASDFSGHVQSSISYDANVIEPLDFSGHAQPYDIVEPNVMEPLDFSGHAQPSNPFDLAEPLSWTQRTSNPSFWALVAHPNTEQA